VVINIILVNINEIQNNKDALKIEQLSQAINEKELLIMKRYEIH